MTKPALVAKRAFDLFFAVTGLLLLSPLFLLLAVVVKFSDGGSVLFGQTRMGRCGVPFTIWKFRTMVENASSKGLAVTARDDVRITPVGRWLRRHKLDELPQLWNVLVGDMSFVGPRPEVPKYVATYDDEQRRVLDLKPGITDRATLEFVNEEDLLAKADDREDFYVRVCIPRKIALNLEYAHQANFVSDLALIVRTVARLARFR